MDDRVELEFEALVASSLGKLAGLDVVDMGAGSGRMSRHLAAMGARVVGVEPNPAALGLAEAAGGGPRYIRAGAEATGLPAASADLVIFTYSLHHAQDMHAALTEAIRVLRREGRVAVLEPEAGDPFWPVGRFIDDETALYAEAQAAIDRLVEEGRVRREPPVRTWERYRMTTPEALLADMQAIDSTRGVAEADRPAFEAAFADAVRTDADGAYLEMWARFDVLTLA